jgi:hypothetical protein
MANSPQLKNFDINIKLKLSALWVSVMFCYVYGDFFSLFVPGRIQNLMNGNSGGGRTTPVMLLVYAILMTLPPMMIFLSLILRPKINRVANLATGTLFTLVMLLVVATSISKWMLFYTYLGVVEVVITCLIIVYAWKWPKE